MEQTSSFSCTYTPNVAELLIQLNGSLAMTSHQAGKLIFISPDKDAKLIQASLDLERPMGLVIDGKRMTITTKHDVGVWTDAPGLTTNYPSQPNTYDALYMPRATYHTGAMDLHDMHWGAEGLYAVNTRFSCISLIDNQYSFTPIWKPSFVTGYSPTDRCHLNGMAMQNDRPKYTTALGTTNEGKGWRPNLLKGGVIIDVESSEMVATNLPVPHSPRLYDGELYALLSATGQVVHIDVNTGKHEVIVQLPGFLRGMTKWGEYLFVGLSKLRKNASTFRDLPVAQNPLHCGVEIIHLPTGVSVGNIRFPSVVEELYDVQALEGKLRPHILSQTSPERYLALNTPNYDVWMPPKTEGEKGE
ncbi:MAG: TIGR03032 family protein [Chitinophagales bacterium]